MNQTKKIERPYKDERDQQIESRSRSHALDFMITATEILTVICLIKGNTAWIGCLAILLVGAAATLVYKFDKYGEKPYLYIGIVIGLIGIFMLIWFGISG